MPTMAAATDPGRLPGTLAFVAARRSGSDLRLLTLLDEMWKDPSAFAACDRAGDVRRTILGFKYWLDEPGTDSVRYWSESHALCFSTCAYLAGLYYPGDVFANSGLTGTELAARAERRIRAWLAQRYRLGMSEWLCAETMVEVLACLTVLIDRAPDENLATRCKMVADLVMLDLAMYSFEGDFAAAAARVTRDPGTRQVLAKLRATPRNEATDPLVDIIVREGKYDLPPVLQRIAYEQEHSVTWSTFGLNPGDVGRETSHDPDDACVLAWQIGAYTSPETVKWSTKGLRKWGLSGNRHLNPVKRHTSPLSRFRHFDEPELLPRARVTSLRNRHFQLSSVQSYRVGSIAQARPWQAVLPGGIHVTSIHPASATGPRDSGLMPAVGQSERILLTMYDTRHHDVRQESKVLLPFSRCDETRLGRTWMAAQSRGTFLGILSVAPMELVARDEVVQRGPVTGWAIIMGDRSQVTSLSDFVRTLKESRLILDKDSLHLHLAEGGHYAVDNQGLLTNPRGRVIHPAGRYQNPWVQPFTVFGRLDIEHRGHSLHLDWNAGTRTWT